jgi:secretion/DNA translocation related TadE-like protein
MLAALLAICAIAAVWMAGAQAGLARQRAEVAADLAVLAASQAADSGSGSPCVVAAQVAARNGGQLTSCKVRDTAVDVSVVVTTPTTARASARAGPLEVSGPQ